MSTFGGRRPRACKLIAGLLQLQQLFAEPAAIYLNYLLSLMNVRLFSEMQRAQRALFCIVFCLHFFIRRAILSNDAHRSR